MYGINEDAYWYQYQIRHDPQWRDDPEEFIDDYGGKSGSLDRGREDYAFEEDRLAKSGLL